MKIALCITGDDPAGQAAIRAAFREEGFARHLAPEILQVPWKNTTQMADLPDTYIENIVGGSVTERLEARPDIRPRQLAYIDYEAEGWMDADDRYTDLELRKAAETFGVLRRRSKLRWAWWGLPRPGPGYPIRTTAERLNFTRELFDVSRPDWICVNLYVGFSIHFGERTEDQMTRRINSTLGNFQALRTPGVRAADVIPFIQAFQRGGNARPLHPTDAAHWFRTCKAAGVQTVGWWIIGKTTDPEDPLKSVQGHIDAFRGHAAAIREVLES